MYTNADTLTNKMDELLIKIKTDCPHIIMINEVKPKNSRYHINKSEFQLPGYNMITNNWEDNHTRGIICYIDKKIESNQIELKLNFQEVISFEVNISNNNKILINCIYKSPNSPPQNSSDLLELIKETSSYNKNDLIIIGDFNYSGIDWDNWTILTNTMYNEKSKLIETLRDSYLDQCISEPTRVRGTNKPSILDLILTNNPKNIADICYSNPLGKSDHCVISFTYQCKCKINNYKKIRKLYDKGDYTKIKDNLNTTDWKELMNDKSVQEQWDIFNTVIKELEDKHIPTKTYYVNDDKKGNFPLPANVLKTIRKKHNLWKKFMVTREGKAHQDYCRARNKVKNLLRKARKEHEKNICKDIKTNPKRFWQYINSKSKTRDSVADLHTDPDDTTSKLITENQEKANLLNDYFSSVFINEPDTGIPHLNLKHCMQNMQKPIINEASVYKLLSRLNPNKSCGPDGIHPRFIKELAEHLSIPINIIFNTSINSMDVPREWKEARISAIFKKGNKKCTKNYRPISLTCILCKLLEQIVRDSIVNHMITNKFFTKKQFGFINGRSTGLQLLRALDEWTGSLENGNYTDCIYMDFQKAFDTVPHKRLMAKLTTYGITDPLYTWISSFLSNRRQYVDLNNEKSNWAPVLSGIPQGSVLGPILFVIYINDLPENLQSSVLLFADDTKIFREIANISDIRTLQDDLNKLSDWSEKWLLKFHPDKCISLSIGNKTMPNYHYSLKTGNNNHKLEWVDDVKDIGVVIDNSLNFDKHINAKINKANQMMGIIRRSYRFLDNQTFKLLYKALVRCHFDYASTIWNPFKKKHIDAIESVQRRATKQLPNMNNLSYQDRLKSLKLPTLAYRRLRGDVIEIYKIVHAIYDKDVCDGILNFRRPHQRPGIRGHEFILTQESIKKPLRKNFLAKRVITIWNSIPYNVVNAQSLNVFKNALDRLWCRQDLLYDYKAAIDFKSYTSISTTGSTEAITRPESPEGAQV